jgi:hypothetical protein
MLKEGQHSHSQSSNLDILLAGSTAGFCFWLAAYPLDNIKTQIQSGNSKGFSQAIKYLVKNKIMWRGITIALIRSVPINATTFVVFENVQSYFKRL